MSVITHTIGRTIGRLSMNTTTGARAACYQRSGRAPRTAAGGRAQAGSQTIRP